MIRKTTVALAAVLLACTSGDSPPGGAGSGCQTTGRIMSARAPLFLLATARGDTVRAGPGPIQYNALDTTALETIHGQRFRLEAAGGGAGAVAGAGREVVLVPYGRRCGETWRWRDARWVEAGERVVVEAELRPRESWVGGMPTFDVELVHGWYPGSEGFYVDINKEVLSPAQVFALFQVLPSRARMHEPPDARFGPLLAWAGANPRLATRFPASAALEEAYEALQPCTSPHEQHPIAGTYRVTVVVERADTLHTWFRTDPRGQPSCGPTPPVRDAVMRPRTADSTRLYLHGHPDADAIPESNEEAGSGGSCAVIAYVANQPAQDGGRRAWRADYYSLDLPWCFPDHPRVQQAADAALDEDAVAKRPSPPGWFRETAGGGMRFDKVWLVEGRPVLELRGERVSTRTLAGYW